MIFHSAFCNPLFAAATSAGHAGASAGNSFGLLVGDRRLRLRRLSAKA
jgi:hypothetical protein